MPAVIKIATPSHFAATGDAVSSRPVPASAAKATAPTAAQVSGLIVLSIPIRTARPAPTEAPLIKRVHSTATGATDGSIIAAIITIHSPRKGNNRSEEHTSELQSLRHLVCRLLLE